MSPVNIEYTPSSLPPFLEGLEKALAMPKPETDVVYCIAPADARLVRPASWGPGQALEIRRGTAHIAQDAIGDAYPNLEFDHFYEVGGEVLALRDNRALYLKLYWQNQGHKVRTFLAKKTKPAIILGKVQGVEGVFKNHEGTSTLDKENGGYILMSPLDSKVMWYVTSKVFNNKYEIKSDT